MCKRSIILFRCSFRLCSFFFSFPTAILILPLYALRAYIILSFISFGSFYFILLLILYFFFLLLVLALFRLACLGITIAIARWIRSHIFRILFVCKCERESEMSVSAFLLTQNTSCAWYVSSYQQHNASPL